MQKSSRGWVKMTSPSMKTLLAFLIVGGVSSSIAAEGPLCSSDTIENNLSVCRRFPKSTYRFRTLRDLSWFLTPRTYFLTNANSFTYRTIHEGLFGKCAKDKATLEKMKVHASYAFGDLTLSAIDEGGARKFMTLICTPKSKGVQNVWSLITSKLKRHERSPLDWPTVEETLFSLSERNPHLEDVVPDLGHFRCHPHPLCQGSESSFCSPGINPSKLADIESVITWTDHISNTTQTGTALMLMSCLNEKPSWSILSSVKQQGRDSIDEFWDVAKRHSFKQDWFERQNYHEDYDVGGY